MLPYKKELKSRARALRRSMTDAEQLLWTRLRRKQVLGVQFYRQKPLTGYIVDFYCAAAKLVVNNTANHVTDLALQIAGGSSITRALPLERHFRDVRAGSMQPPSGDSALELIGRAAIEETKRLGD